MVLHDKNSNFHKTQPVGLAASPEDGVQSAQSKEERFADANVVGKEADGAEKACETGGTIMIESSRKYQESIYCP